MFDPATIEQLKADVGEAYLGQLFTVFSNEAAKLTEQIMAISVLDREAERLCHSLKSCARSYGATELALAAEQLESYAKNDDSTFFTTRCQLPDICNNTLAAIPFS